jgi:hypothetical protein
VIASTLEVSWVSAGRAGGSEGGEGAREAVCCLMEFGGVDVGSRNVEDEAASGGEDVITGVGDCA